MSRLEEELGDFLGSVLGRVGGSGLASINLPTFYLRLPVASWGVGLSGRPLPLSLSLCVGIGTLSQSSLTPFVRPSVATLCLFGVCVLLSLLVLSSRCVFVVACFLRSRVVFAFSRAFFAFFGTCFLAFFLSLSFLSGLSPSVLRVVRGHSVALSSFGCSLVQSLLDSRSSPPRSFLSLFIVTI